MHFVFFHAKATVLSKFLTQRVGLLENFACGLKILKFCAEVKRISIFKVSRMTNKIICTN